MAIPKPAGETLTPGDLAGLCSTLIGFDTSNPGGRERPAADYIASRLAAAGLPARVVEPEPGRSSVVSWMPGAESGAPPLLVHGHLDVVPATGAGWTHPPFSGRIADGCVWGRGAADMKGFVAMMLGVQLALAASRRRPRRPLVFAYFADEEAGGRLGAGWIAERRPELLRGATEALGEVGGFSVELPDGRRVYPLQVAERGSHWIRIRVPGAAGHAALSAAQNAVVRAARLVTRIAAQKVREPVPAALIQMESALTEMLGGQPTGITDPLAALGSFGQVAARARSTMFVPTRIHADGGSTNVVPGEAEISVDCRYLPGGGERALAAIRSLLDPDLELELIASTPDSEAPPEGPLPAAIARAVRRHDPDTAGVIPYVMPAGTDASALYNRLGIRCYGFTPLVLPPGYDYLSQFHAVDERIPVTALERGAEILNTLLLDA